MESGDIQSTDVPSQSSLRSPGAQVDSPGSCSHARPVFGRELYWFALICLGTWILAVSVLSPRLARNRKALEIEKGLEGVISQLSAKEKEFEAAIAAMENDPYYREAVYRALLGVKRSDEVFLKGGSETSDN